MSAPPLEPLGTQTADTVRLRPARRRRSPTTAGPWWLIVPALVVYTFVVLWPNLQGMFYSLTSWDGTSGWHWSGLANFRDVLSDSASRRAILNTFLLTAIVAVGQNVIGLLLALGLNSPVKSRYILRVVFFLPVVLTPLVTGYLWKYLLSPTGSVNTILENVGLGFLTQDWLGNPDIVLFSICAAIIWQGAGYSMVIYLAGLQAVPDEVLEASALDGAGPVRRTRSIVIPLINGSLVINLLLSVIGNLKQFDTVWAMTQGGPGGASETMATIVYKSAFTLVQYPLALAQGVALTLCVAVLAIAQFRLTQRQALA